MKNPNPRIELIGWLIVIYVSWYFISSCKNNEPYKLEYKWYKCHDSHDNIAGLHSIKCDSLAIDTIWNKK